MKAMFKCDFCQHTEEYTQEGFSLMLEHEATCSFNPAVRGCYTCAFRGEDGYPISGSLPVCRRGLSVDDNEDGGCGKWISKELKPEECDYETNWDDVIPIWVNLKAKGYKFLTKEGKAIDDFCIGHEPRKKALVTYTLVGKDAEIYHAQTSIAFYEWQIIEPSNAEQSKNHPA